MLHYRNTTSANYGVIERTRHSIRCYENLRIFKQMNPSSVPLEQVAAMRPVLFSGTSQIVSHLWLTERSPMQENPRKESGTMDIPDYAIQRIARCLLPRLLAYFESEEGQRELASGNSNATADHSDASLC
ncbi:MAG: hypothetical protein IJ418_08060, partial [Clostridia bacterium]|nr:hypothetical protein [Clostridia bacterium]